MTAGRVTPRAGSHRRPTVVTGLRAPEIEAILASAAEHARVLGWPAPVIEHVFLAILDHSDGADTLTRAGVDVARTRVDVSRIVQYAPRPTARPDLRPWLDAVDAWSRKLGHPRLSIGFLLAQVLAANSTVVKVLAGQGVSRVDVLNVVAHGIAKATARSIPRARVIRGAGEGKAGTYTIAFHNDDFTTFEFVCEILAQDLGATRADAEQFASRVGAEGSATFGVYNLRHASKLVAKVTKKAHAAGHPLLVTVEPSEVVSRPPR